MDRSHSYVFSKNVLNWICNLKWFKLYPWLGYDEISDIVTIFFYRRGHPKLGENVEKPFTSAGYLD